MKEREKMIATGLTLLLLILWIGFVFHRSPRFAGSALGGMLAIAGAILMLVPLAYLIVKRIKRLKKWTTQFVSMRTLLSWHIYAGIVGPILVLLHTGHKFNSLLGILLTSMTLVVVISGFVGRYLMQSISIEIREKKSMLANFRLEYDRVAEVFREHQQPGDIIRPFSGFFGRLFASFFVRESASLSTGITAHSRTDLLAVVRLSESIADVEYAIRTHETFKQWFGKWLKLHIAISMILYFLMALHVWASIHFGLRWFEYSNPQHFNSKAPIADFDHTTFPSASELRNSLPGRLANRENSIGSFSVHFDELYRRYWRPAVHIHGISTTAFDYAGIAAEAEKQDSDFSKAVTALRQVDEGSLRNDVLEKTFWINVYNFAAMKLAAEHYPVSSIIDAKINVENPWGVPAVKIGDASYSLKQIENSILLKKFDDPRIVFAISCAAVSCPDRTNRIFSADLLDEQLDQMLRQFFSNRDKGLLIDRTANTVTLSRIMKQDRRLFGDTDEGVIRFVQRYVSPDDFRWIEQHSSSLAIQYFEHDWGLNDIALADNED